MLHFIFSSQTDRLGAFDNMISCMFVCTSECDMKLYLRIYPIENPSSFRRMIEYRISNLLFGCALCLYVFECSVGSFSHIINLPCHDK